MSADLMPCIFFAKNIDFILQVRKIYVRLYCLDNDISKIMLQLLLVHIKKIRWMN